MKRLMFAALAAVSLAVAGCDPKDDRKYGTYNTVVYLSKGSISKGEWTSQYTKARAYAVKNRLPFVFFWGNAGCGICESAERSIGGADFKAWMKKSGYVFAFDVNNAVGGQEAAMAKAALGSVPKFPGVGFYWPKSGRDETAYYAKIYGPMTGSDIVSKAAEVFGGRGASLAVDTEQEVK